MIATPVTRVSCPNSTCERTLGVHPEQFGKRLRCPSCRQSFNPTPPERPRGLRGWLRARVSRLRVAR